MRGSSEWQTPQWLFDELNAEFNFDIDLCATFINSKCDDFCRNYLDDMAYCISERYEYRFDMAIIDRPHNCFINPPYSNPYPFIKKAWEDSKYCKIVLLLPSKTDTKWWRIFWQCGDLSKCETCNGTGEIHRSHAPGEEQFYTCEDCWGFTDYHGPRYGADVRFMPYKPHHPSRIAFVNPETGKEQEGNPCGSCVVIFDRRENL